MIIDKIILDDLTEKAKQSQRLRCNLDLRNGSYGLIEIKLGGADLINDGAESLKTLSDKIDTTKIKLLYLFGSSDKVLVHN